MKFDIIISNSLLHHLHKPEDFWETVKALSHDDSQIFIADLFRPESESEIQTLVTRHMADSPPVLKKDFYNSLNAAFTPLEIQEQLEQAGLTGFEILKLSDRHQVIFKPT